MAKYLTTMTVWHGGRPHFAGEAISLTSEEAKPLLASGALEAPAARKPEPEAPQPELLTPAEQPEPGPQPADPAA